MRAPKKKATAEKLRAWRASLMRSRSQLLGIVYAPDERSAKAAAVAEFKIGEEQRRRLIVRCTRNKGARHTETASGRDRPHTVVKDVD
jgi:hypothetical protein